MASNAPSLESGVLGWSFRDIMNTNLFARKLEEIPPITSSMEKYFESFKYLLLEEVRAGLHQSLQKLSAIPFQRICFEPFHKKEGLRFRFVTADAGEEKKRVSLKPTDVIIVASGTPPRHHTDLLRGRSMTLAVIRGDKDNTETDDVHRISIGDEGDLARETMYGLPRGEGKYYVGIIGSIATSSRVWAAIREYKDAGVSEMRRKYPVLVEVVGAGAGLLSTRTTIGKSHDTAFLRAAQAYCEEQHLNPSQLEPILKAIRAFDKSTSSISGINRQIHIQLIQGPPGTGKTSTIANLITIAASSDIRVLFCAPTNASCEVGALRLLQYFERDRLVPPSFTTGVPPLTLGDIVITGSADRLDVSGSNLGAIFVGQAVVSSSKPGSQKFWSRSQRLSNALSRFHGCAATAVDLRAFFDTRGKSFDDKVTVRDKDVSGKTMRQYLKEKLSDLENGSMALSNDLPSKLLPLETRRMIQGLLPNIQALKSSMSSRLLTDSQMRVSLSKLLSNDDPVPTATTSREGPPDFTRSMKRASVLLTSTCITAFNIPSLPVSPSADTMADMCLKHARVVFCTVSSAGKQEVRESGAFPLVVVDEAAQLIEAENILPCLMSGVELMVLVGDPQQLPATVISQEAKRCKYDRSLFERLVRNSYVADLLGVQYRMRPVIAQWQNATFYDGRVKNGELVCSPNYVKAQITQPYCFVDIPFSEEETGRRNGKGEGSSLANPMEAAVVLELLTNLSEGERSEKTSLEIGVITPYARQVSLVKNLLAEPRHAAELQQVDVKSVDGFQGREKDLIIFSAVRSNNEGSIGFVKDRGRLNVAISRAKHGLWILGNAKTLQRDATWRDLIGDAIERKCYISVSKSASVRKVELDKIFGSRDKVPLNPMQGKATSFLDLEQSMSLMKALKIRSQ